jgi:light-regulated signal transduction histidine kinase (bacteriophytochrome)
MWDNPIRFLLVTNPSDRSPEAYSLVSNYEQQESNSLDREESSLQRLLSESAADELAKRLKEPFRLSKTDLVEMVSRGVAILSTMAAELGVILRVQIRGEQINAMVDGEKIRRVFGALIIHLLTVSQSEGWVTIGLSNNPSNGRRGSSLRLTADSVMLPLKTNPEYEEELNTQAELSLCRKIIEKHGGNLAVTWHDDNKLTYLVWLPA